jgi:hypothetical protein
VWGKGLSYSTAHPLSPYNSHVGANMEKMDGGTSTFFPPLGLVNSHDMANVVSVQGDTSLAGHGGRVKVADLPPLASSNCGKLVLLDEKVADISKDNGHVHAPRVLPRHASPPRSPFLCMPRVMGPFQPVLRFQVSTRRLVCLGRHYRTTSYLCLSTLLCLDTLVILFCSIHQKNQPPLPRRGRPEVL